MKVRGYFSRRAGFAADRVTLPSTPPPTVEEALGSGAFLLEQAGIESARLDAECLLGHALSLPRWRLAAAPQRRLSPEAFVAYLSLLERRERREPLAYLVGGREFWSLPLAVSRNVLVPRPETETVVEVALAVCYGTDPLGLEPSAERRAPSAKRQAPSAERRAPGTGDGGRPSPSNRESRLAAGSASRRGGTSTANLEPRTWNLKPETSNLLIVDLCTGSGAIAIALARELPSATVLASDISWRALRVARANAAEQGVAERITFLRGSVWRAVAGALGDRQADVVAANPPYIPSGRIPALMPEVRWEPRRALDGGPDGLAIIRDIVAGAPQHLRPGGVLLLEVGADQGNAVTAMLGIAGAFEAWRVVPDLAGLDRVVVARRRGK
ncbi:MAG: peptide chain release factor N(5)-glutamine methyltransferase [candidate division NC10 bacterium]|nr:peptide chain release factor N(5)-glutamine methyltransferase [candidate division NC10 bacterium]